MKRKLSPLKWAWQKRTLLKKRILFKKRTLFKKRSLFKKCTHLKNCKRDKKHTRYNKLTDYNKPKYYNIGTEKAAYKPYLNDKFMYFFHKAILSSWIAKIFNNRTRDNQLTRNKNLFVIKFVRETKKRSLFKKVILCNFFSRLISHFKAYFLDYDNLWTDFINLSLSSWLESTENFSLLQIFKFIMIF